MNSLWNKLRTGRLFKNGSKRLALSVVILCEVIAIAAVATFAWVETVSSIKITNEANTVGLVKNDTKYTDMLIGNNNDTINLLDYFESAGDMHLAPASSADGKTFYFPKVNDSTNFANVSNPTYNVYRKGNVSDKNTTYLSASFRLKADTNADFFFTSTPAITVSDDIRVSVTAYTEGDNPEGKYDPVTGKLISNTKIYANNASTTAVVNATDGSTGATTVEKFTDHQKGKSSTYRLFAVGANETKIVTINVWLQKKPSNNNTDLTTNMSAAQAITNLGITSSLTPRHVTLIPTPTWNNSSPTYYAWCYNATNGAGSRLYKLELDDNEHYSFDYNGTYQKTTFVRAVTGCTVQPGLYDSWPFSTNTNSNSNGYWNQTVDTTIPSNPGDPTYIIETIDGGSDGKSTGSWHDPAIVKVATCTGQSSWGTLTATSYVGTTTSTHVIETTNSSSQKHKDTVHAWPGKKIKLQATANTDYAFVGWFNNAEGTGDALSTDATFVTDAPSTASEITYYAKFKETRTLTIYRYLDGSNVSTACGTITINGTDSTSGKTATKIVDKGSSADFSVTQARGYTFDGFFSAATGGTEISSPKTINSNTTYYARFRTNTHIVEASVIGSSGSEVQYGSDTSTKGSSFTKTGVKYNTSVTIKALPANGYRFIGWYSNANGTGTAVSTNATYTFTLGDGDVAYYAKFEAKNEYYLKSSWNGWSETQDKLTGTGNELTFVQELDPGQYTFKIYDGIDNAHWSNAYEYKYKYNNSTYLGANGGDVLNNNSSTANMQLNIGYTAKYTFHFNRSTNHFWITAVDITTFHVVGDITGGWSIGSNNKMTRVGSTDEYRYTVYVDGKKDFKILTNSGTWYSNGFDYHDDFYGASGGDTFNSSSGNCSMNGSKKNYVFHFNSSSKKFWITDS